MRRLLPAVVVLSLAACRCEDDPPSPPPAPIVSSGKPEKSGLRATVPKLVKGRRLEVTYLLEWFAAPTAEVRADGTIYMTNMWLLESQEPITVRFWSASGDEVGRSGESILLPEPFRDRATQSHEVQLLVDPPAGAESLSVALGNSGLESDRRGLP